MIEEAMVQIDSKGFTKKRPSTSSLVQLDQEINFTHDDEQALGYLMNQFPADFETKDFDAKVKVMDPVVV
jgi:hypothetical protein